MKVIYTDEALRELDEILEFIELHVRVAPLVRYPYKLFYQIADDVIEALYIHHAARREPWDARDQSSEPAAIPVHSTGIRANIRQPKLDPWPRRHPSNISAPHARATSPGCNASRSAIGCAPW
jgi:hypothetical protein